MDEKKKKGIRNRLMNAMILVGISTAVCGVISIFSILNIKGVIDGVVSQANTEGGAALASASESAFVFCVVIAVVIIIAAYFSIAFLNSISNRIQSPVDMIEKVVRNVANTGSLNIPKDMDVALKKYTTEENDEISSLVTSFRSMIDGLGQKIEVLEKVAQGDLRHKVVPASEDDVLSITVNAVVENISSIVQDVVRATEQLSTGANEISLGAQTLSQSSSEQSATMDQLHLTAAEIADEAVENAGRAAEVSKVTAAISLKAAEGSSKMLEMNTAMKEINAASHAIGSVMKAIDEIAFQTNILALNAAVEAARAGVHGKGFAVVADEVRNLATKSGSAANDSNALIADTIAKSDMGNRIVDEAIEFFKTIEEGIANTSILLDEIAEAARNQSESIDQINQGVTDMTNVVYHNSATSEQSAAASEEMSSQALILKETVNSFLIDGVTVSSIDRARMPEYTPQALFTGGNEPEIVESVQIAPQTYEPAAIGHVTYNPTTDSNGGGRSPAEIYAEALGRGAPGATTSLYTANEEDGQSFSDDTSKY